MKQRVSVRARRVGWLALTARSQSAPWAAIALATSALVAMASMETSAPFSPSSARAVRAARDRGELVRLVGDRLLGQHQAGGGGEGGDEMERPGAGTPVVAAARGLAVDRHEAGLLRPAFPDPGGEGGGEEAGIDPVHQDGEPALAGHAMLVGQVPAQEVEMRRAPGGDVLVVVAVGNGAANHEQQHLGERMQDPPHVARVLHLREVIEQRRKARLPGQGLGGGIMGGSEFRAAASIQQNSRLSPVI